MMITFWGSGVGKWLGAFLFCSPVLFSCNGREDKKQNAEMTYYPDGKLLSLKSFANEGRDWTTIKFFQSGDTSSIAHYHNWKYSGEATIFYPNGKKNFQQNYDTSGQSDGIYRLWNMEGQLKETGLFVHGKKQGTFKTFFDDGNTETIAHYKDGKKDGQWIFFNEKGDTLRKEYYSNDSIQ